MKKSKSIIFLYIVLACMVGTSLSAAEFFILSVNKKEVRAGEQIVLNISVNTPTQSMNAVSGVLVIPEILSVNTLSKEGSVVNFWTEEPHAVSNTVRFEGVVLNPGYQGPSGKLFTVTLTAKKTGEARFYFNEGAILANDGFGTNIIDSLSSLKLAVTTTGGGSGVGFIPPTIDQTTGRQVALPVIVNHSKIVLPEEGLFIEGKGEPNMLTKIVFKDVSLKSLGERFVSFLQRDKKKLDEVFVQNDTEGRFSYSSGSQIAAGVYNATPFLVEPETKTEKPGLGVQLLVDDNPIVHYLVVLINVLGLLIPVVLLGVAIYFIPWYSGLRMRILKKKVGLEEEEIEIAEHRLRKSDPLRDEK